MGKRHCTGDEFDIIANRSLCQSQVCINFSASSEVELIAWILSFGEEAKVIQPEWMVKEIKERISRLSYRYNQSINKTNQNHPLNRC